MFGDCIDQLDYIDKQKIQHHGMMPHSLLAPLISS